jgi:lipoate-protein ligase A
MKYLDQTLPDPEQNLGCDEALLDLAETETGEEVLRVWEAKKPFVVLGYGNIARKEVHVEYCQAHGIPILRRCSGGGAVLQTLSCLNYALVLRIHETGPLRSITEANCYIMRSLREMLQPLTDSVIDIQGYTDLTIGSLKFSGNAQRRRRRFLLFHGTFLLHIDFQLMEATLTQPTKEPAYRQNRPHRSFLAPLNASPDSIKSALRQAWAAHQPYGDAPGSLIAGLVREKYSQASWNLKF